jgi:hypothetical protein
MGAQLRDELGAGAVECAGGRLLAEHWTQI